MLPENLLPEKLPENQSDVVDTSKLVANELAIALFVLGELFFDSEIGIELFRLSAVQVVVLSPARFFDSYMRMDCWLVGRERIEIGGRSIFIYLCCSFKVQQRRRQREAIAVGAFRLKPRQEDRHLGR